MTQCHQGWKECDATVVSCKVHVGAWCPQPGGPLSGATLHSASESWAGAVPDPHLQFRNGGSLCQSTFPHSYGHVLPFQQPSEVVGREFPSTYFLSERTEAQRGRETCPRTHSKPAADARRDPVSLSRADFSAPLGGVQGEECPQGPFIEPLLSSGAAVHAVLTAILGGLYCSQSRSIDIDRPGLEWNSVCPRHQGQGKEKSQRRSSRRGQSGGPEAPCLPFWGESCPPRSDLPSRLLLLSPSVRWGGQSCDLLPFSPRWWGSTE